MAVISSPTARRSTWRRRSGKTLPPAPSLVREGALAFLKNQRRWWLNVEFLYSTQARLPRLQASTARRSTRLSPN